MNTIRLNTYKVTYLMAKMMLSNGELCKRAQMSTPTVRRALVDGVVSPKVLGKLAKALEVEPEEIMLL